MRVNISYSIELEDVPTVIAEMIEEVCNELQHTAADKLIDAAANLKTNDEVELSRVGVSLQQISKTLFALYESLRKTKNGIAVAVVTGGVCDGCRIALSSSKSQRLTETNELPRCGSCQRILYAI